MSTRFQRPKFDTDAERLAFLIEARTVLDQQIREVRARMSGKRSRRSSKIAPGCRARSRTQSTTGRRRDLRRAVPVLGVPERGIGCAHGAFCRARGCWNGRIGTLSGPESARTDRGLDQIRLRSTDRMSIVTPTSVYLYYDQHDILIYVGITSRGVRRNIEHKHHQGLVAVRHCGKGLSTTPHERRH